MSACRPRGPRAWAFSPAIGAAALWLQGCWPAHGDIHLQDTDPGGPYTLKYTPADCVASFSTDSHGRSSWRVTIAGDRIDRETESGLQAEFRTDDVGLQVETPGQVELDFGYTSVMLRPKMCSKYVANEWMDAHHDLHVRFDFDCRSQGAHMWGDLWSGDCMFR